MVRSWVVGWLATFAFLAPFVPVWSQDSPIPLGNPSTSGGPSSSVPPIAVSGESMQLEGQSFTLPPELEADAKKAVEGFRKARKQFEIALGEQRATHVRYINGEDQTPKAAERYRSCRDETRRTMGEAFEAAMEVFRYMPDQDAGQFLATVIQHRIERDIYDRQTLRGASRLMEARVAFAYVYEAAARCAVVEGEFDFAKQVLETLEKDKISDTDRALLFQLENLKEGYAKEVAIREEETKSDQQPRVRFFTTRGNFEVELFLDSAPSTVSHFIELVESGFYDGLDFYQVIENLLALTGDPTGLGTATSGKMLADEHEHPKARDAFRGSLVMAKVPLGNKGDFMPNSASCQFAILFLPQVTVSAQQTVFGRVISGMDVVSSLRRVDPSKKKEKNEIVVPPDRILTAEVVRRPDTLPEPVFVNP